MEAKYEENGRVCLEENKMQKTELCRDVRIPQLGLGTYDLNAKHIATALAIGYRLLDTAWQYGNESEVGKAIKESQVPRDEIFVTSKLWTDSVRSGKVREELEDSLRKLGTDYLDLYLIHWPAQGFERAWETMCKLKEEGKVHAIGVSNFQEHHFQELARISDVIPVLNQIECHPFFQNKKLISFCRSQKVAVQAWCPLGGAYVRLADQKIFQEIGEKYHKSAAQIILRWHLQTGILVIPRSSHVERQKQNLDVFDFELSAEDMAYINALDTQKRIGADPDQFDF